jgi:hypothetical protein
MSLPTDYANAAVKNRLVSTNVKASLISPLGVPDDAARPWEKEVRLCPLD